MKTIGVVLAGGLSRRFGSPKAFARIEDKYFYEYAVAALVPHCDQILIVTRPELVDRFPSKLHVITDEELFIGLGPLAGIYSAMNAVEAERYIILPCDMPYIEESIIEGLITYYTEDVIAIKTDDNYHPLVSIWHCSVKDKIRQSLEQRRLRVMPVLNEVETLWIDGERVSKNAKRVFENINYKVDLERGEGNGGSG